MMKIKEKDIIDVACKKYKEVKNSGAIKFNTLDIWLDKESNLFKDENKQEIYKQLRCYPCSSSRSCADSYYAR